MRGFFIHAFSMIILRVSSGAGNQLFQYAAGRKLAHKWNTRLKLDLTLFNNDRMKQYILDQFNITGTVATPEEIEPFKKICMDTGIGKDREGLPAEEFLNWPDNIYLDGYWCNEGYFPDIRDILLTEFTLKNPLSPTGKVWEEKILSAECAVAIHFRHGDILYNPIYKDRPCFHVPPLDYYYNCIKVLRQAYENLMLFVFSNNLQWVKENFRTDLPIYFVEGWQKDKRFNNFLISDIEEIYLMSLCKHMIKPQSSFSWWGAYLNKNPDKKIFTSYSSTAQNSSSYIYSLKTNKNSPFDTGKWIRVPFDHDKQPEVTMTPIFSLLLVVDNDVETIIETLDSIFEQNYKYYEVIIIDNASTDGSDKICRKALQGKENVVFKKLYSKVKIPRAWNMALGLAEDYYVLFLKGNDRLSPNTLKTLYSMNERKQSDIVHCFAWLEENANGDVCFADKKFSRKRDLPFIKTNTEIHVTDGQDAAALLLNRQINTFMGTKIYNRDFLLKNRISFNENFDQDKSELYFQLNCFLSSDHFFYVPYTFYVAPRTLYEKSLGKFRKIDNYDRQIVRNFNQYFTARIDFFLITNKTKAEKDDFEIMAISDDRAEVRDINWLDAKSVGYVLLSYFGYLEFVVKVAVKGKMVINLRGIDYIIPVGNSRKRIPYWVDYTKLVVNGNVIIDKLTPAWHDKAYSYTLNVTAGEEIMIRVEWLPHRSDN